MPTLTAAQTEPTYFFDEPFDNELDDLFDSEPQPVRASLAAVIGLFLTLALLQVGMSALIVTTLDLSGLRLALVYVVAAPALLYSIVAAWDHRQLRESGHPNPTPWIWALFFPPVYLILRWAKAATGGHDRMRAVFGWVLAQSVVTLSLILLIVVGTVAAAAPSADAAGAPTGMPVSLTAEDTAYLLTPAGVEDAVTAIWASERKEGSVECPTSFATEPGTQVTCYGILEGARLNFTIEITTPVAGQMPWTFASWTALSS